MEGLLVMSAKERERLKIFLRVKRGELAESLGAVGPGSIWLRAGDSNSR